MQKVFSHECNGALHHCHWSIWQNIKSDLCQSHCKKLMYPMLEKPSCLLFFVSCQIGIYYSTCCNNKHKCTIKGGGKREYFTCKGVVKMLIACYVLLHRFYLSGFSSSFVYTFSPHYLLWLEGIFGLSLVSTADKSIFLSCSTVFGFECQVASNWFTDFITCLVIESLKHTGCVWFNLATFMGW